MDSSHGGDKTEKEGEDPQEMKILLPKDSDHIDCPITCDPGDDQINVQDPSCCKRTKACLKRQLFIILNVLGILIGFAMAFGLRKVPISEDAILWISLPGEVFLRLLKVTIVPLIVANVIAGSSAVEPASNGRAGLFALAYTLVTNFVGSFLGVLLAVTVKPGRGVSQGVGDDRTVGTTVGTQDIFVDLIRNLFPDNIIRATMEKVQTTYVEAPQQLSSNLTNATASLLVRKVTMVPDTNIIGLLFFCGAFGIAVGLHPDRARPIREFFKASADVILIVLGWFVWVSPLGVCSLIMSAILKVPDLEAVFLRVVIFFVIVTCGVVFLELVFSPSLYLLVMRRNPYPILPASARAWAIAFASSGSSCAMPEMFRVVEAQGCDTRLSSLTVPISVTLNANGSALFITASVIFLAQVSNLGLGVGQYGVIGVLAAISAMVLPSVPSASIVTVVMILGTLSIPITSVGLLFTVEWFLDRLRTTGNVMSEIYGVIIIDHLCKRHKKTAEEAA